MGLFTLGAARTYPHVGAPASVRMPVKILVAPDKFKHAASASEVAHALAKGFAAASPDHHCVLAPIADGGEGTDEILAAAVGASWRSLTTVNPYGQRIATRYAWDPAHEEGPVAIMTMARANGLATLEAGAGLDLGRATTWGTGEMLRHAALAGARSIVIGLGGSATNDGGMGLARALGYRFLAAHGGELTEPRMLVELASIQPPAKLRLPTVTAACDVDNPLLGKDGATNCYGGQKGATPQQRSVLEAGLARLADVARDGLGHDPRDQPGAGAAGGLGYGLSVFAGATLVPGFFLVARWIDLERQIESSDIVVTGEGRIDGQSLHGKATFGVATLARHLGKPVIAFAGQIEDQAPLRETFDALHCIAPAGMSTLESMVRTVELLEQAASRVVL